MLAFLAVFFHSHHSPMGDQFNSWETQFNKVTECPNSIGTFHLLLQRYLSHLVQWPGVQERISIFLLLTDIIEHIAWVRHGFIFNICVDVVVGECNIAKTNKPKNKTTRTLLFPHNLHFSGRRQKTNKSMMTGDDMSHKKNEAG